MFTCGDVLQGVPSARVLGWVDFDFECYTYAWADENLVETARQLGKMVEHPNQSQVGRTSRWDTLRLSH